MYWSDLRHRHQRLASDIDIEHRWFGHDIGPHKRGPLNKYVLEPTYQKDLNHGRVHACGVYSTLRRSTRKYSLIAPKPTSARVSTKSRMHGT